MVRIRATTVDTILGSSFLHGLAFFDIFAYDPPRVAVLAVAFPNLFDQDTHVRLFHKIEN